VTAPPMSRTPMASEGCDRAISSRGVERPAEGWRLRATATIRRLLLTALVLGQTGVFPSGVGNNVLPYPGAEPLELAILSLSSFLFAWVSLGFWTAVTGFLLLCWGR